MAEGVLTLRFTGNADMSVVEPLDEYLVAVHGEALRQKLAPSASISGSSSS